MTEYERCPKCGNYDLRRLQVSWPNWRSPTNLTSCDQCGWSSDSETPARIDEESEHV